MIRLQVLVAFAALCLVPLPAAAGVTRVDIRARGEVGASGYEKIVGVVHFAIDPRAPRNSIIADLDRAPVNGAGRVEFEADLYILRPTDPVRSNGVALFDILNRGFKLALQHFNAAPGRSDFQSEADFGDGFLMRQGYTIVWVGWQFDAARGGATMGLTAPVAAGIAGIVRAEFTPDAAADAFLVADLAGYRPLDAGGDDSRLTVRDGPFGRPDTIARERWTVDAVNRVTLTGGFQPGRTYELSYRTANPPVAGVGLAAVRDVASWLKHDPGATAPVRFAYATGASQSARYLRTFLYDGFNADEEGRQVFDGVQPFGAGAARLSLNERWAVPGSNDFFRAAQFPFADGATRDPSSGREEGLLDNDRARPTQPKILHLNTSSEYWGSGRSAALTHTSASGVSDLTLPENTRIYLLASSQHLGARFPPRVTTGQLPDNTNGLPVRKALLVALDRWVREDAAPPASRYPRLSDGSLVPAIRLRFPAIPGVRPPQGIPEARDGLRSLPLLVPQVDGSGNDLAGIASPMIAAPLGTYTGWNFRNQSIGGATELMPFLGFFVGLPKAPAERESRNDPRVAVSERYASKADYLDAARRSADRLVRDGYLLAEDVGAVMQRAEETWDIVAGP